MRPKVFNVRIATQYLIIFIIFSFFSGVFLYVMWNMTLAEQDALIIMEISVNNPTKFERTKEIREKIARLKRKEIKITLYAYYEKGRKAKFSTSNELIKSVDKYVLLSKEDFTFSQLTKK